MPEQLIQIDLRKAIARLLTILALVLALLWAFFVVKWYLGNTLAEYHDPDENGAEMATLAVSLAPNDPLTHWRLGEFTEKRLPPEQIVQTVSEYEKAVSLSPNDYRFWMAFGRALEQAGEIDRGEKALRRAVDLAPSYSYPRWYLGNLLLRRARYSEAFAELQRAGEADPEFRPQLFNLAYEVFKNDLESLTSSVGTTPSARAELSLYLIGRQRIEEGLRLWKSLSETDRRDNHSTAEAIISSLAGTHRFHQAADVWNDIVPGARSRAVIGQILDGGFEDNIAYVPGAVFGWHVQSLQEAQIGIDPNQSHSGGHSLRLVFMVLAKLDSLGMSQIIPVKPDTQYSFECYLKTQKLESAGTPVITLIDEMAGIAVAASEPAPTGNNNWQRVALTFKTGPKTEGVVLRMIRASCGDNVVCPMFGTIWYDDFSLRTVS